MLNFERVLWKSGVRDIAGVDEAGVGPLAGPVVAAAVMFTADPDNCGIDDSKRLDAETRAVLAAEIRAKAAGIGIGIASVGESTRQHLSCGAARDAARGRSAAAPAAARARRRAHRARRYAPQNSFNKGDGINFSIAAASIIAKTERDRMMEALDRELPGLRFATHKGYGTPEHRAALQRLGPSACTACRSRSYASCAGNAPRSFTSRAAFCGAHARRAR